MSYMTLPERTHLSNGIPVLFCNVEGGVAATYWWVGVGSAHEKMGEWGFAHFLEHMLFKDANARETGAPSTGKLAQKIEGLGGDINAYTSFDQTVYHVTCSEQHWEKLLVEFVGMAKNLRFLKADFEREREVIIEELRRGKDSADRQLFESVLKSVFGGHPYGRPIIGTLASLVDAKMPKLEAFYNRNYIANQMGLVLVGPLGKPHSPRRKRLLKILEAGYGRIPSKSGHELNGLIPRAKAKKGATIIRDFDISLPRVVLAFPGAPLLSEQSPLLDLVTGTLGVGELSRLYLDLFHKRSLVTDVHASYFALHKGGLTYFDAELSNSGKLLDALSIICQQAAQASKQDFSLEEKNRIIQAAENERTYSMQTVDGLASRICFSHFMVQDPGFDDRFVLQMKSASDDSLKELASRTFRLEKAHAIIMLPRGDSQKETIKKNIPDILKEHLPRKKSVRRQRVLQGMKKIEFLPGVQVECWTHASGIQCIRSYRPHSQIFSVHTSVLGGSRGEWSAHQIWPAGISHLLSQTWIRGTTQKTNHEIAQIVESAAADLSGFSGRNSVGLEVNGLKKDWPLLSDLFAEVLTSPTFPEEELIHSKRVTEDSIRSLEDQSSQLCSRLFLETLYQYHPYGKLSLGTLESLQEINSETLKKLHSTWIHPKRLVISVSGPVSSKEIEGLANKIALNLQQKQMNESVPINFEWTDEPPANADRWVYRKLGREQSHLVLGGLGLKLQSKSSLPGRLLQTLLSGQGGRLFIELREKKSLAYSVAPLMMEGLEKGYVGTYIGCAPSKRSEALLGIRKVYEALASKGPSSSEWERTKELYLGRRSMEMQTDASLAAFFGQRTLYGLPLRSEAQYAKDVRRVAATAIRDLAEKLFLKNPQVQAVVI